MRIQLLPSTFDAQGVATLEQRLTCFLIDDCVAVDAGSIAIALSNNHRYSSCMQDPLPSLPGYALRRVAHATGAELSARLAAQPVT